MVTHFDHEFQDTKLMKRGTKSLEPWLRELAIWIAETRKVAVLNLILDTIPPDKLPRLQVIVENEGDLVKFQELPLGNFFKSEQDAIANRFRAQPRRSGNETSKYEHLLVVFSAFAPLAREEAVDAVPETEVDHLLKRLSDPALWTFSRCLGNGTLFVYTEEQRQSTKADTLRRKFTDAFYILAKAHDEFGYLSPDKFSVAIDSKENLDKNYQGSWLNYYR